MGRESWLHVRIAGEIRFDVTVTDLALLVRAKTMIVKTAHAGPAGIKAWNLAAHIVTFKAAAAARQSLMDPRSSATTNFWT